MFLRIMSYEATGGTNNIGTEKGGFFGSKNLNHHDLQLRLDFIDLRLGPPTMGDCNGDQFIVRKSSNKLYVNFMDNLVGIIIIHSLIQ